MRFGIAFVVGAPLRSLRGRVTLITLITVGLGLAAADLVLVGALARDARHGVDMDLDRRVSTVIGVQDPGAQKRVVLQSPSEARASAHDRRALAAKDRAAKLKLLSRSASAQRTVGLNLLGGSGVFTRVIIDGQVVKQAGDVAAAGLALPTSTGFATANGGGEQWRTLTVVDGKGVDQLGESLGPALARAASEGEQVVILSLIALGATGAVVWLIAGVALRPVRSLRAGAERVSTTRDLSARLVEGRGPAETVGLARALNAMLARLAASSRETELALAATRRFAADTGHELRTPLTSAQANLDVLQRNHQIPAEERDRILNDIAADQRRLVDLLDALQALARGDAAVTLAREPVDVADVLDAAVQDARRRWPLLRLRIVDCVEPAAVLGWPEGIRIMVDNLLRNSAVHAGPRARVDIALRAEDGRTTLTVDDDGPGVPLAERNRIFERFTRGTSGSSGSGLGLALVAQQAALHGGGARVGDGPLGGACFEVWLRSASPSVAVEHAELPASSIAAERPHRQTAEGA